MKFASIISIATVLFLFACGDNSPTDPAPNITAQAGTWTGETSQEKEIEFFVTTSPDSVGNLLLTLDISGAPDIYWEINEDVSYDHEDGTWEMPATGTLGDHTHTIALSGTFTASNLSSGTFTATSETYYGGYYLADKTFSAHP